MRARHLLKCLAWIVSGLLARASLLAAPAGDSLPEPIAWRQLDFMIPFKVVPAETPDQLPTQVRLYMSANLGGKWDLAQSVGPEERNFLFRAPGDGEYWFQIRTVDRQGRMPDVGGKPELRVVVDTLQPRLELKAARGEAGEVRATWQAVDPLLNADSLKIEYQTASGQWRAVALDRPSAGGDRSTTAGTLTWFPNDAPSGTIPVRAEIADRAGNVAVSQAKAEMPRQSGGDLTASRSAAPRGQTSNISAPMNSGPSSTATAASPPAPRSGNSSTPWPADNSSDVPFGRRPIPSIDAPAAAPRQNDPTKQATDPSATGAVARRAVETINPPIRNQVLAIEGPSQPQPKMDAPDASSASSMLPPGQRPRMVSSKSFDLEYEVDAIGPAGIAKVELWGTRDGGRTWSSYGVDSDNRSPIRATVEGEGLYGFRLVVQSGSGLGGLPPRSGDPPEVWIMVDLTKPVVQLTGVQPGEGPHAGELLIHWVARDNALAARPITILFSEKSGGPWSTIAAGLENSGQYAWRPDNRVPDQIYLRIEARDEAGNTGTFDAPQPVALERIRPEGRIRGVRAIGETALTPRMPADAQSAAGGPQVYQFYR